MTTPVFTWSPDVGASRQAKPRVRVTKFGDGYERRAADGINSSPKVWSVTFTADAAQTDAILRFLETLNGVSNFQWTDPLNATGKYVSREWTSKRVGFGVYEVSTKFEQVYES